MMYILYKRFYHCKFIILTPSGKASVSALWKRYYPYGQLFLGKHLTTSLHWQVITYLAHKAQSDLADVHNWL